MNYKTLVTDVDGVLTPGTFFYTADGKVMKEFGPHDSDGVKILRKAGIDVVAISADRRGFQITERRLNDMGVAIHLVGESERLSWLQTNFDMGSIAYVGDGYHDVTIMKCARLSYAPADACKPAREAADIVLETPGGKGVLLEVALDLIRRNG